MNDIPDYVMRRVHHVIEEVSLNIGLHGGNYGLIPDEDFNDLHDLFLDTLFPEVLTPYLMLRFGRLFFRGGDYCH
jgi:hypothetical protein